MLVERIDSGDDCTVALLQTAEQKNSFRTQALFGHKSGESGEVKYRTVSAGAGSEGSTAHVATGGTSEYRTLNDQTLQSYYGSATPYGTVQRFNYATDSLEDSVTATDNGDDVSTGNVRRKSSSTAGTGARLVSTASVNSTSQALYATIIRPAESGVREITFSESGSSSAATGGRNVSYMDFLPPRAKKQGMLVSNYEPFG